MRGNGSRVMRANGWIRDHLCLGEDGLSISLLFFCKIEKMILTILLRVKGLSIPLILSTSPTSLMNLKQFSTTMNLFVVPGKVLLFVVQTIANEYDWKELHVICDPDELLGSFWNCNAS